MFPNNRGPLEIEQLSGKRGRTSRRVLSDSLCSVFCLSHWIYVLKIHDFSVISCSMNSLEPQKTLNVRGNYTLLSYLIIFLYKDCVAPLYGKEYISSINVSRWWHLYPGGGANMWRQHKLIYTQHKMIEKSVGVAEFVLLFSLFFRQWSKMTLPNVSGTDIKELMSRVLKIRYRIYLF